MACICVFLALAVFAVFGQTVHFEFVGYDDPENVYENPVVRQGLSLNAFGWAFTHAQTANWIPLTTLSHILDCQIFGLRAGGHHLVNVLFHAANAVLLFLVLRQATGCLWRSAFVAAVFAVHPLRAESVAWVSERKDVLSGLFFLLAIGAYVRQVRQPFRAGQVALLIFFALGLLAKSMVATLPFVLLLLDSWPLGRMRLPTKAERGGEGTHGDASVLSGRARTPCAPRRAEDCPPHLDPARHGGNTIRELPFWALVKEKIPLFVLSAASCVATALVPGLLVASRPPFLDRIGNALVSFVIYPAQMLFPVGLATPYATASYRQSTASVCLAFILLAAITAGVILSRKKRPCLLMGWLWYLGMSVPVIGFIQLATPATHADRYTYLPGIGLAIAATWAVADWSAGWKLRRWVLGGLMIAAVGALTVCGHIQTSYWKNEESLCMRALACTTDNYVAMSNMGILLARQGKLEEARTLISKSLQIAPHNPEALNSLGNILAIQGADDAAIAQYQKAVEVQPGYISAHSNLGKVFLKQGKLDDAVAQYRKVLELNPGNQAAQLGLGNALLFNGDFAGASACLEKAVPLSADRAAKWCGFGDIFLDKGAVEKAIPCYREAIRLNPRFADAFANLALALLRMGADKQAIDSLQQALAIKPDEVFLLNDLAWLLATAPDTSLRNGPQSVALAARASQLSGETNPVILHTLAAAYAQTGRYDAAAATDRRALELAAAQKNTALATALQEEMKLYETNTPLRNAPQ